MAVLVAIHMLQSECAANGQLVSKVPTFEFQTLVSSKRGLVGRLQICFNVSFSPSTLCSSGTVFGSLRLLGLEWRWLAAFRALSDLDVSALAAFIVAACANDESGNSFADELSTSDC